MKRIPNANEVKRALRNLKAAVRAAQKGVNRAAGKLMTKGDYPGGEAMAGKGREVKEFTASVEELGKRWQALCRSGGVGGGAEKSKRTPEWAYFQPILRALRDAGGEARAVELERLLERSLVPALMQGDREIVGGGRERWRQMVRRARKHLAAEGWIASGAGPTWRITAAGTKAADQPAALATGAS
jgi:Mrr N-terminal domain